MALPTLRNFEKALFSLLGEASHGRRQWMKSRETAPTSLINFYNRDILLDKEFKRLQFNENLT